MILPVREAGKIRNEFVEFKGLVVRSEPEDEEPGRTEYDIAIYFHELTEEARRLIDRYVRDHCEG